MTCDSGSRQSLNISIPSHDAPSVTSPVHVACARGRPSPRHISELLTFELTGAAGNLAGRPFSVFSCTDEHWTGI